MVNVTVFCILSVVILFGGVVCLFQKNVLKALYGLFLALLGTCGIYFLLCAPIAGIIGLLAVITLILLYKKPEFKAACQELTKTGTAQGFCFNLKVPAILIICAVFAAILIPFVLLEFSGYQDPSTALLKDFWKIELTLNLCWYLILAMVIFLTGAIIAFSSDNTAKILTGLAFMVNSAGIAFVAANSFITHQNAPSGTIIQTKSKILEGLAPLNSLNYTFSEPLGQIAAVFVTIFLAAALIAGFAMVFTIYKKFKTVDTAALKGLRSNDCPNSPEQEDF